MSTAFTTNLGDTATCNTLVANTVITKTWSRQGATDGSTLANPTPYNFQASQSNIPVITISAGFLQYSFIAYNSGTSQNFWSVIFQTSIPNVASNYSIRVYIQNLWNTTSSQVSNNNILVTATGTNTQFAVQINYSTFGSNTQLSPVGIGQPFMMVVELDPYP